MESSAEHFHLTCKFLDLTEKSFTLKMYSSNFQRRVKLEMWNCMKFLRSMEKLRVWKHQSIQIILQEVTDSYVTKTLSLQETPFKTSQSKLRLLNSNQKMWRKPRERLSTTFTSKTFQLTTLMLKSRICSHHSEPSSLVLFNQTISENLPLFAMMIQ